jgi:NADH-quinone oxidoreductase subunit C
MTRVISGEEIGHRIEQEFPGAVTEARPEWAEIEPEYLLRACTFVRDDRDLNLRFLSSLTGVDRIDRFEVVYHLLSVRLNQGATLRTRATERENPEVPSVVSVWRGAHLQEREAFDLLGIRFRGHPDLRRIFLWEGFPGHPLRKDWLNFPGGQMAGLERFPGEPREPLEGRG